MCPTIQSFLFCDCTILQPSLRFVIQEANLQIQSTTKVARFASRAKKTTQPLLQVPSEERNTTNMITAIQTENCSLPLPSLWKNAENVGTNGYLKSRSNTDGRKNRPLLFL